MDEESVCGTQGYEELSQPWEQPCGRDGIREPGKGKAAMEHDQGKGQPMTTPEGHFAFLIHLWYKKQSLKEHYHDLICVFIHKDCSDDWERNVFFGI